MTIDNYPSKLLEKATNEFSKLPGVGRKTALRLVLHLLKQEVEEVKQFSYTLSELVDNIKYCKCCNNISDSDTCEICSDSNRDKSLVCVVENVKDVMAIENTQQYNGVYHVLGAIISPMDGIGPNDLFIDSLIERAEKNEIKEIVFALSATMEGDTTNFYLFKKLAKYDIKVSVIARGVSIGDELEYADEITLGRSIVNRIDFSNNQSI